jgi:hypothetical protein
MDEHDNKPVVREALYDEVWSEPVIEVAKRYGLSDVGLAKVCRKLRIPLPSRGYWAKVKAGRVMHRVPLPALPDRVPTVVQLTRLSEEQVVARQKVKTDVALVRKQVEESQVLAEPATLHPLIKAAVKRLRQRDGWTDEKGLRSAPQEVLHLEVTKSSLGRALRVMDALLKELAKRSITVTVNAERQRTILDVGGTSVSLMLSEHVSRSPHKETPAEVRARERYYNSWRLGASASYPNIPRFDYQPTGILMITAGRWPSRSWKDTPRTPLEKRLGEVVAGILALAKRIHDEGVEKARKEEAHRQAVERYNFFKGRLENEQNNFKQFEEDAIGWERAMRLRAYVDAIERHATIEGTSTTKLQDWIAWARAKADWIDPLILVSDPILDAPEPKWPSYY